MKVRPTQYNETIRIFSLTLHSLSPRAYNYVRQKFNKNLPHTSTIRKWYSKSSSNGEPGISEESLNALRNLAAEDEIYVTLSFDEMNIRRNIQWSDTQKKFLGHITYGSIPHNAQYLPVANYAIVFMVNGVNNSFNIPVAFHFINCLQAYEKAALLILVLRAVSETGVKVLVVLFDGLQSNFTVCRLLGSSFDIDGDFAPYLLNPFDGEKVFIILDAPHMIKLIRNCIGTLKTLYVSNGKTSEWKFFEMLEDLRAKCDIVTHKITKQHILFTKNIMNVALATQLLSESAAKSMEHMLSLPETTSFFEGSEATIDFTRRFDKLFDVFNSSVSEGKKSIFKNPINDDSKDQIYEFLDETVDYIKNLKISPQGKSVLHSRRKTSYLGFILNIANLKEIRSEYVDTKKIDILPMRMLNQDPLENFFGRIRTTCLGKNKFFVKIVL